MRGAAAVVLEVVAGPDRRVRLVERELLRAELAAEKPALPGEVALDRRPHPLGEGAVAGPAQVAEERVDGD